MACSPSSSLHDESIVTPFKGDHTDGSLGPRGDFPLKVESAHSAPTVYV